MNDPIQQRLDDEMVKHLTRDIPGTSCTHHWTVTSECPACLRTEVERLRATITEMEAGYSRAAKMIVGLKADLEAARAEISARSDLMQGYLDCWRNDKARAERAEASDVAWKILCGGKQKIIDELQQDLAAARALLREAITHVNCHAFSSADRLAERIDTFLAGERKP